jgi:hypothetical protein
MITFAGIANGQWPNAWTSIGIPEGAVSGWVELRTSSDEWRFFTLDTLNFRIMSSSYSQTAQYVHNFTAPERLAGEEIYSLGLDLTGDDIVEFYVLSWYGTSQPYRQAFRIFDIASNTTVFERDDMAYSYDYPTISDIDQDNQYECTFKRYNYPSSENYFYEVYDTGVSTSLDAQPGVPQQIRLHQNFPNPFNPQTSIEYSLQSAGHVQLDVYNLIGQHVTTLVNERQEPGQHFTKWNGADRSGSTLASGNYYYQLRLDGKSIETRKMILLK